MEQPVRGNLVHYLAQGHFGTQDGGDLHQTQI